MLEMAVINMSVDSEKPFEDDFNDIAEVFREWDTLNQ